MTYLVLSLCFLVAALVVLAVAIATAGDRAALVRRWWAPLLIAGVVIAVLTAVFDNLMIGSGLMTYGEQNISGAKLGLVPIEDFAYPLGGLMLLPSIWLLLRRRRPE